MSTKSTNAATPPSEPRLGRTLTLSTRPYLKKTQEKSVSLFKITALLCDLCTVLNRMACVSVCVCVCPDVCCRGGGNVALLSSFYYACMLRDCKATVTRQLALKARHNACFVNAKHTFQHELIFKGKAG